MKWELSASTETQVGWAATASFNNGTLLGLTWAKVLARTTPSEATALHL
jgi:hypothetical protein